jgi:hypothetical protein
MTASAATAALLMDSRAAMAILSGTPTATAAQARFETVPLGVNDQTPKFSGTTDGKLDWELNCVGSGGFGGWPDLGAPSIVSDTGATVLPLSAMQASTATYGGGTAVLSVASVTGAASVGLGLNETVSDAGPNGTASVTTGFASATWTNSFDQPEGNPLDMMVILSQIVTLPSAGLMEMSLAGNTGDVTGGLPGTDLTNFYVVAGVDNASGGRVSICYGNTSGAAMGLSGFTVTRLAPTTYWVRGFFHFGQVAFDGESVELNANVTLAMDPAVGSFARPGPIPMADTPVASGGAGFYGSESPGFSSEWTNAGGGSDFNNPGNFSNGAPPTSGEAFLADTGASTPGGTMISAAGAHTLHLITVANSIGNYTIGLMPHQGSFNFGSNGGIEVYTGGATVNNCDISSTGLLNFRLGDPTTTLKQYGTAGAGIITMNGLGTLQFESSVTFSTLQANLGTTEFVAPLTTGANFQIGSGALVQMDAPSTLTPPGTISIAANGTLALTGGTTVGAGVINAGLVHLSGLSPNAFIGTVSNTGTITIDSGAMGIFSGSLSGAGAISNQGSLSIGATASCGNITGSGATMVAGHASLTQAGATFAQGGGLANNGSVQLDGSGAVGPISGSGTLEIGNGFSANTVQLASSSGANSQNGLIISPGSTLDINNNHFFINYAGNPDPITAIAGLLLSGYNGGAWNGPGIDSSAAAANSASYSLGYADSADPGNPAGLSLGQIEIKYTLLGDADLNGTVNGIDFGILAANFNKTVSGWDQGDFDYNNIVNGLDFTALAANFNKADSGAAGLSALSDPALVAFAEANGLMADVPEPTCTATIAIAATCLVARRRRTHFP